MQAPMRYATLDTFLAEQKTALRKGPIAMIPSIGSMSQTNTRLKKGGPMETFSPFIASRNNG